MKTKAHTHPSTQTIYYTDSDGSHCCLAQHGTIYRFWTEYNVRDFDVWMYEQRKPVQAGANDGVWIFNDAGSWSR